MEQMRGSGCIRPLMSVALIAPSRGCHGEPSGFPSLRARAICRATVSSGSPREVLEVKVLARAKGARMETGMDVDMGVDMDMDMDMDLDVDTATLEQGVSVEGFALARVELVDE